MFLHRPGSLSGTRLIIFDFALRCAFPLGSRNLHGAVAIALSLLMSLYLSGSDNLRFCGSLRFLALFLSSVWISMVLLKFRNLCLCFFIYLCWASYSRRSAKWFHQWVFISCLVFLVGTGSVPWSVSSHLDLIFLIFLWVSIALCLIISRFFLCLSSGVYRNSPRSCCNCVILTSIVISLWASSSSLLYFSLNWFFLRQHIHF